MLPFAVRVDDDEDSVRRAGFAFITRQRYLSVTNAVLENNIDHQAILLGFYQERIAKRVGDSIFFPRYVTWRDVCF